MKAKKEVPTASASNGLFAEVPCSAHVRRNRWSLKSQVSLTSDNPLPRVQKAATNMSKIDFQSVIKSLAKYPPTGLPPARRFLFDIEANGLGQVSRDQKKLIIPRATTIHCICAAELDANHNVIQPYSWDSSKGDVAVGWDFLCDNADVLIGHNIVDFDLPVCARLLGRKFAGAAVDSLILARLTWPEPQSGPCLVTSKGACNYGRDLETLSTHYGAQVKGSYIGGWSIFNASMLAYCQQDVQASVSVLRGLIEESNFLNLPPQVIEDEHAVSQIISDQKQHGIAFDSPNAGNIKANLGTGINAIVQQLQAIFPPTQVVGKKPAHYAITYNGQEVQAATKAACVQLAAQQFVGIPKKTLQALCLPGPAQTKSIPFNPASDAQVVAGLQKKYGWVPTVMTDSGKPSAATDVLKTLPYPEAALLVEHAELSKLLTFVEDWELRANEPPGNFIHGSVNPQGAVTGRMTHSQPNLAAVPKANGNPASWGTKLRALFIPRKGCHLVGCDLSGLELRMLAHYMFRHDDGAYADIILKGDIHSHNQQQAGLATRDQAKRFIYAFLYGAGDAELGRICGTNDAGGKRIRRKFLRNLPALEKVKTSAEVSASLRLPDGRMLPVRSKHAALNAQLQGSGAIVAKKWLLLMKEKLDQLAAGKYQFVLNVHDEVQIEVNGDAILADTVGKVCQQCSLLAGQALGIKIPIDSEYKVGQSWADTH